VGTVEGKEDGASGQPLEIRLWVAEVQAQLLVAGTENCTSVL
jgi:hypothetical protein